MHVVTTRLPPKCMGLCVCARARTSRAKSYAMHGDAPCILGYAHKHHTTCAKAPHTTATHHNQTLNASP